MTPTSPRRTRIAIVGSGFSGLCLGVALRRAGIRDFTIFEKAERLGGTWRDNTYPGACCDVPSMLYCLSFEPRTDWPRKWSPQSEILAYMDRVAEKWQLHEHIRFGTEIERARFDEGTGRWRIRTTEGEETEAEILVSGTGQLHRPALPDIPGLGSFQGVRFHSARWRHDVDLRGKRVGVIGNAASAIQFIPRIAGEAERVTIFQRTPNWMVPRGDRPYTDRERRLFARFPLLARLYRGWIWARAEIFLFPVVRGNRVMSDLLEKQARAHLEAHVADPALREALTPDYPICGKRVLISDDYYPALGRDDVELVTRGVDRITEGTVVDGAGTAHEIDVLILATGFDTTHFVSPMKVEGRDGRLLDDAWREGAEAYLGMTVAGFPNFFMMYGPNTNLGHNSIVFMIECQTRYILACIEKLAGTIEKLAGTIEKPAGAEGRYMDLRPEVMRAYNERIQRDLQDTAWAKTERSWYKNEAGRITNNWPYSTLRYWWETRRVDWGAYRLVDPDPARTAAPADRDRRAA